MAEKIKVQVMVEGATFKEVRDIISEINDALGACTELHGTARYQCETTGGPRKELHRKGYWGHLLYYVSPQTQESEVNHE